MTSKEPPDYENASEVDPGVLAESLPDRPLNHSEAQDMADSLSWSCSTVSYATESGTEYVPEVFLFRFSEKKKGNWFGDACILYMDDRMTEWQGKVEREDISHETWVEVIERWSSYMNAETSVVSAVTETERGEVRRLDFEDPDNMPERGGDDRPEHNQ